MKRGEMLLKMIRDYTAVLKTIDRDSAMAKVIREHVTGLLVVYVNLSYYEANEVCLAGEVVG